MAFSKAALRWRAVPAAVACLVVLALAAPRVVAQEAPPAPPPQVQDLVRLLDDPAVRQWLDRARTVEPAAPPSVEAEVEAGLAARLEVIRQHLRGVAAALPRLPAELKAASGVLLQELSEHGLFRILVLVVGFVALGYGSEWALRRTTAGARARLARHPMANVADRLRVVGLRVGFGLAQVAVFGIGSVGAFLIFDWPPLLRRIVLAYLVAILIVRLVLMTARVLLDPASEAAGGTEPYRVVPMTAQGASFWLKRLVLFSGYYAFGRATVGLLPLVGFSPELRNAAAYLLGLGLLAIALEAIWRRPAPPRQPWGGVGRTGLSILLSAYGVLLWLLWVAGLPRLFWLAVVAMALPKTIAVGQSAVAQLLRPAAGAETRHRGVVEVVVERGFRTVLIVAATLFLADAWGIDLVELTARDTTLTRIVRGGLTSVVILILADFVWEVVKAAVDSRLSERSASLEPGSAEAIREARLRTLLPIFRNVLMVVIAVMAGLIALSALGVDIGPLIAGAGVFGVAVGFGAQTLVKDVISGIFYLLDDAFRVGEYIQSGSYKGVVESFSLRSVKLRHHRGPIYTVPFGELGAVQNMSRDWVIDKFQINVTYDTDLEKARKLIKQIGRELSEAPEFGHHILEPLKMQGVEQFGEYGIQIRMKMTTRPGEQFVIRRKALARIKQAFDENGIQFALPSVQVSGGDESAPAAARQVVERLHANKPSAV